MQQLLHLMSRRHAEGVPVLLSVLFLSPQPVMAKKMSQEEAVKIIQVAERARQGRERAKFNMKNLNMNTMYRIKEPGAESAESAAVCIQKVHRYSHTTCHVPSSFSVQALVHAHSYNWMYSQVWKGYVQRKRTKTAREEEMILLGMVGKMRLHQDTF